MTRRLPRQVAPGLVAGAVLASLAVGAVLAAVLLDDDPPAPEVPVPAVAEGAEPLGSSLPEPELSSAAAESTLMPARRPARSRSPSFPARRSSPPPTESRGMGGARGKRRDVPGRGPAARSATPSASTPRSSSPWATRRPTTSEQRCRSRQGTCSLFASLRGRGSGPARGRARRPRPGLTPVGGLYGLPEEGGRPGGRDRPESRLRAERRVPSRSSFSALPPPTRRPGPSAKRLRGRRSRSPPRSRSGARRDRGAGGHRPVSRRPPTARMFVPELLPGGAPIDFGAVTIPGEGYVRSVSSG